MTYIRKKTKHEKEISKKGIFFITKALKRTFCKQFSLFLTAAASCDLKSSSSFNLFFKMLDRFAVSFFSFVCLYSMFEERLFI